MKLSRKALKTFEDVLERGVIVEATVTEEGKFSVKAIPERPDEIALPQPCLVNQDEDVTVEMTAHVPGDVPIQLFQVVVPAGFFITAIKGARR